MTRVSYRKFWWGGGQNLGLQCKIGCSIISSSVLDKLITFELCNYEQKYFEEGGGEGESQCTPPPGWLRNIHPIWGCILIEKIRYMTPIFLRKINMYWCWHMQFLILAVQPAH